MSKQISRSKWRGSLVLLAALAAFNVFTSPDQVGAKRALFAPPSPPPAGNITFDFDGDGKADVGRWNKANTELKVKNSGGTDYTTYTIGSSSAIAAPGDFNGDGKTDPCVFYNGTWTYKLSPYPSPTPQTISLGQSGDIPVAGDYDGDGITDAAVFRPSSGGWIRKNSSDGKTVTQNYGQSGDIPVAGNFNGDSKTDFAVFRITSGLGYWYIMINGGSTSTYQFGQSGDIPIQADFDNDSKNDVVIYRPQNGQWWVLTSSSGFTSYYCAGTWGSYGDQPVAADYDGDGHTDMAVWRATTGVWMIVKSSDSTYEYKTLGIAGDEAVPSAYTRQIGNAVGGDVLGPLRLNPKNATGGTNLYSQNFGWSTSLVSLPGRAGLDLNIGLSYNSLVWIKDGSNSRMYFDPDSDNVSPGFRFGFPTIDPIYYDAGKSKWTYLMATPSGGRTEFRQIGASASFEAADSSYAFLQVDSEEGYLDPNAPIESTKMTVFTTDGTRLRFEWIAGAFRCIRIMDRNGNYLTMSYDPDYGSLWTVTDTLGRVITVHYDTQLYPTSITQTWNANNGQGTGATHTWATFTYTTQTVSTNFYGLTNYGPPDNTVIKVLQKVTYADGSYTQFSYNGYVQVQQIENHAANDDELNRIRTNLDNITGAQSDCPRFTHTYTRAQNFNVSNGSPQEVDVQNDAPTSSSFTAPYISETTSMVKVTVTNHPTSGFYSMIHYAPSGWKEGLTVATEDCIGSNCSDRKRWTWTNWTQDNTGVSYISNPRVTESQVGDGTNTKKTTIEYYSSGGTYPYGLPVKVMVGDLNNVIKTETTAYNLSSNYTVRRIIGLPAEKKLYQGTDTAGTLMSKVSYTYDDYSSVALADLSTPTHQCRTSSSECSPAYGTSFAYRGNVTKTTRWDANYPTSDTAAVSSYIAYNIAGMPVSTTDPRGRLTSLAYSDANMWNDGTSRTTYAYPTTITDPGDYNSTIKYRYDIGANVEATGPPPAGQSYGKKTKRTFDDTIGRITRQSVYVNTTERAYTWYEYFSNAIHYKTHTPLVDVDGDGNIAEDEVVTETWTDGAGRVLGTRTENPDSAGGWTAFKTEYDILGRVHRQTVPTEVSVSSPYDPDHWSAAGDDSAWLWNSKEYDWKGRVTREVNTDGSDRTYSYAGCGCAGGQITTIGGEETTAMNIGGTTQTDARRTQKIYEDILGRVYKSELWDLNGAGSAPYSTTKTTFNGRDQATLIRKYVGADTSTTYQDTTIDYDGHGRIYRKHLPEESGSTPYTQFAYNADDTLNSETDARGMGKHFTYGHVDDGSSSEYRNILTKLSYTRPLGSNIELPVDVSFAYDAAGNRTSMTEGTGGTGTTTYAYDELSRITSETKTFPSTWSLPDSPGSGSRAYTIVYNYFLNGAVKQVTDPFGKNIYYTADHIGRMKTVTGDAFGDTSVTQYVDDVQYRAWGAEKEVDLHNNLTMTQTFDNRQRPEHFKLDLGSSSHLFDKTYTYLADGKLSHSTEGSVTHIVSSDFERSYVYDFGGRIRQARTGYEAGNRQPQSGDKIPYHLDYSYDAFNHNTERDGTIWFESEIHDNEAQSWSASTNRVLYGWLYDDAGNVTYSTTTNRFTETESDQSYDYNAAGTMTYAQQVNGASSERWPDGLQRPVYVGRPGGVNYLIYSTVFGKVLMEATLSGAKQKTYVHDLSGGVIAIQQINYFDTQQFAMVRWEHTDPSGASYMLTSYDGSIFGTTDAELDPTERAVKMTPGDTEQDPSPWGGDGFCPLDRYGAPVNCAAFASDLSMNRRAFRGTEHPNQGLPIEMIALMLHDPLSNLAANHEYAAAPRAQSAPHALQTCNVQPTGDPEVDEVARVLFGESDKGNPDTYNWMGVTIVNRFRLNLRGEFGCGLREVLQKNSPQVYSKKPEPYVTTGTEQGIRSLTPDRCLAFKRAQEEAKQIVASTRQSADLIGKQALDNSAYGNVPLYWAAGTTGSDPSNGRIVIGDTAFRTYFLSKGKHWTWREYEDKFDKNRNNPKVTCRNN